MMAIRIIEQSTAEREQELNDKYEEFKDYYYNTELSVRKICEVMGIAYQGCFHRRIRDLMRRNKDYDSRDRGSLIRFGRWLNESNQSNYERAEGRN